MTHVHYIDCSKWKKVIGIVLWIGATIGLGFGIYYMNSFSYVEDDETCFKMSENNQGGSVISCSGDEGKTFYLVWSLLIVANGLNSFVIWHCLNNHYKWLEIRCGKKPKNEDESI